MHTPLLAGILSAEAVLAVAFAVLFARAWRQRPSDREFGYFALLCLALAGYLAHLAALNLMALGLSLAPLNRDGCLRALTVHVSFAVAFQLHFALRYGQVRRSGRIMLPIYALAVVFSWLGVTGAWWIGPTDRVLIVSAFGLELHLLVLEPAAAVLPFFVEAVAVGITLVVMTARRRRRTREPGVAALVGAVVALAAIVNDIALSGLGYEPVLPLMPVGLLALGFGVAMTMVARYGRVSTELEQSTRALQERSRDLELSYRELKRTQDKLRRNKQLAVVGELSAVIAHEVRNPLAIVNNAVASLRKRHTRGDERRVLLNIINEEMGRLDQLVMRMLDYARPLVPARQAVDLRALAQKGARLAEEVAFEIHGDATVVGDAELLRRALDNLIQNAVQAGARRIAIELASEEEAATVRVIDDGEGMDAGAVEAAQSPFFTTRPTGTGLGLPVVARIVAAHGGVFRLESERGEGTIATLEIGRASPPVAVEPERISVLP